MVSDSKGGMGDAVWRVRHSSGITSWMASLAYLSTHENLRKRRSDAKIKKAHVNSRRNQHRDFQVNKSIFSFYYLTLNTTSVLSFL